jgi:hypothetical protein
MLAPIGVFPIASIVVICALPIAIDGSNARASGNAVEVHGASAAQRHAATEFRSGHAQHVAQHQWRVPVDIDTVRRPIDVDGESHGSSSLFEKLCGRS